MKRRAGVLTALVVAVVLGVGVDAGHGLGLSIGSAVNPGCISMRITYSTCGIIPYPCAHISFWQPKWIVTTRAEKANQGGQHYHFHNAVVRPVNFLFAFNDPCGGCVVPALAALVPAFYESFTDPAWRAAQSPVMPPHVQALRVGLWGGYYPRVGFVTHTSPVAASGLAATRAFDIARQPIDLWPAAGLIRPTIPLVPSAQTVVLPCMCPRLPPFPVPCFRAVLPGRPGRRYAAAGPGDAVGHLRVGHLEAPALHPAPAAQLVRRGAERPAQGQPVLLTPVDDRARPGRQAGRRDSRCRSAA